MSVVRVSTTAISGTDRSIWPVSPELPSPQPQAEVVEKPEPW